MQMLASDGGAGTYLDWGVVHLSLANAIIIGLMLVVFVAALVTPFPHPDAHAGPAPRVGNAPAEEDRPTGPEHRTEGRP